MNKELSLKEIRAFLLQLISDKTPPKLELFSAQEVKFSHQGWAFTVHFNEHNQWSYLDSISNPEGATADYDDWDTNSTEIAPELPESEFDEATMLSLNALLMESK